jgi:Aromatic-ring-opening dioxygenase LigAB, LigA subunit
MSRYATNRVLWEVATDRDLAQRLRDDPQAALAGRDLTDQERVALARTDVRELLQLGVHPFLLYNFALRLNGGFSMEWMTSYLEQLKGVEVADLET